MKIKLMKNLPFVRLRTKGQILWVGSGFRVWLVPNQIGIVDFQGPSTVVA